MAKCQLFQLPSKKRIQSYPLSHYKDICGSTIVCVLYNTTLSHIESDPLDVEVSPTTLRDKQKSTHRLQPLLGNHVMVVTVLERTTIQKQWYK